MPPNSDASHLSGLQLRQVRLPLIHLLPDAAHARPSASVPDIPYEHRRQIGQTYSPNAPAAGTPI
eukprot:2717890-Rhodomonas_salina.2